MVVDAKRTLAAISNLTTMKPHRCLQSRFRAQMMLGIVGLLGLFVVLEMSWVNIEHLTFKMKSRHDNPDIMGWVYDRSHQEWPCMDRMAAKFNRVEDIFCTVLPKFLPNLKNPCFYDSEFNTSDLRCLPYFYIIGMDKSGSTDLHSRIVQHPLMMGNKGMLGKETGFWSWLRYGIYNKKIGLPKMYLDDYLDMFSETADIIQDTNMTDIITGDATPMDLWDFRSWPEIPQNWHLKEPAVLTPHLLRYIHQGQPVKFIIQFREPIERLYSDYIFLGYGANPIEFHQHCLTAIDMMTTCIANLTRRICYFSNELYQALPARIHLGCYPVFLKEWFNVFPRESFLIVRTDEYKSDMADTLDKVFHFLDLPPLPEFKMDEILNQTRRHVTQNKAGSILPETVVALRKFYDECNKEMAELLKDNNYLWLNHYL